MGHWGGDRRTHEAPVPEGKALLQRVEGQVATGALGVVVGAGELGAGRLEAAAGDERGAGGGAEGCTGEHLGTWSAGGGGPQLAANWAYFGEGCGRWVYVCMCLVVGASEHRTTRLVARRC